MSARKRWRYGFLLFVLAASFLVLSYPLWRLISWFSGYEFNFWQIILIWLAPAACVIWAFRGASSGFRYFMVHWVGVGFVFFSVTLSYELIRLTGMTDDRAAAPWLVVIGLLICVFALLAAHYIRINTIEIQSEKLAKPRRVVQLSDVHIGSRQAAYMDRLVQRVNRLQPDIVVITGDLVDTGAVGKAELQSLVNLTSQIYFVTGNHERYAGLDAILGVLEELGVTVLRNQHADHDDIQFIGIDDADHHEQVALQLPKIPSDALKYRILLYHRPAGWADAVQHGIDLMLSGHTHNGQIFPFNWLVKREFKFIKGLYRQGTAHLYVSMGSGTWGPLMRLGSWNEITCIDLRPLLDRR